MKEFDRFKMRQKEFFLLSSCVTAVGQQAVAEQRAYIKPGNWPQFYNLNIYHNDLSNDSVGAMRELLCVPALRDIDLKGCKLDTEVVQIDRNDWPNVQKLDLESAHFRRHR
jgi:hypothetical protein